MSSQSKTDLRVAAGVALVFGILTVISGGRALFAGAEARAAVGNAVPFVLWFNFVAGLFYVLAGLGLLARRSWARGLSIAILGATTIVFVAFGVHVFQGGAYEMRTVGAMVLRIVIWVWIVVVALNHRSSEV